MSLRTHLTWLAAIGLILTQLQAARAQNSPGEQHFLNPQPIPPGMQQSLNPQPIPPGVQIDPPPAGARQSLNPQPIPPGMQQLLNPQPIPPGKTLNANQGLAVSPQIDPPPTRTKKATRNNTKTFSPQIDPPPVPARSTEKKSAVPRRVANSDASAAKPKALPPNPCRDGKCGAKNNLDRFDLGPTFVSPDTSSGVSRTARSAGSSKTQAKATGTSDAKTPKTSAAPMAPGGGIQGTVKTSGTSDASKPPKTLKTWDAPLVGGGTQGTADATKPPKTLKSFKSLDAPIVDNVKEPIK